MQLRIKRLLDLIGSCLLSMILLPIWIVIALIIKLTSKGPILFIQKRPGDKGQIFDIYKFRTMKLGSEKMIKGVEVTNNDQRITLIGKFLRRTKLDETPQLINVLIGDMSLVGPRPERIESLKEYDKEISKRLLMRPGMTGLAQVSGNIHISLSKRYEFDVYYVEEFSLSLDFKILLRTIGVVLFGEEKYVNNRLVNL